MQIQSVQCNHTCNGLCSALEIVTAKENETLLQYESLRGQCTYPEIDAMLEELISERKKSMTLLEKTREMLQSRFAVVDQIHEGFEGP